jgi:predicted amidophosphoribosyltransferase
MLYTNICGKCGNEFQKTWNRCKHCGAKKAFNYPLITIALMTMIIILLVYLILQD